MKLMELYELLTLTKSSSATLSFAITTWLLSALFSKFLLYCCVVGIEMKFWLRLTVRYLSAVTPAVEVAYLVDFYSEVLELSGDFGDLYPSLTFWIVVCKFGRLSRSFEALVDVLAVSCSTDCGILCAFCKSRFYANKALFFAAGIFTPFSKERLTVFRLLLFPSFRDGD